MKEAAFATDILRFAAQRYGVAGLDNATAMTTHIVDPTRWIDLYDVARRTGIGPDWINADGWGFAWEERVGDRWTRVANQVKRREIAEKAGFVDFDRALADTAIQYDVVVFINDAQAEYLSKLHHKRNYLLYVITHECLHIVMDRLKRAIHIDAPTMWMDPVTIQILGEFVEHVGGESVLRQKYL